MLAKLQQLIIAFCVLSLVACGGGGGGSNSSPTPASSPTPPSSPSKPGPANGEVSSAQTSSNEQVIAPQNLSVTAGNASATLTWKQVPEATGYHIYYATESSILPKNISAFKNGTSIKNVKGPYTLTGLQNNTTYYFVVTAVKNSEESAPSTEMSTTPSEIAISSQPTPQEVLVVELINRARFDPNAEALRYGIDLNEGITGTQLTTERKPPVAFNILLTSAARVHSQWMLDNDVFSHTGENGNSPTERMVAAGYEFFGAWRNGENLAWMGMTAPTIDLTQFALSHHEGLFLSPSHRENILGNYREVGVGQKQGHLIDEDTDYLTSMLTEDFAQSGSKYFLTGVIYSDVNNNQFYDVGEGLDGVTISINGKSYPAYSAGAYSIPLASGTYDVEITGPVINTVNYRVQISNANVKLDVLKNNLDTKVVTW